MKTKLISCTLFFLLFGLQFASGQKKFKYDLPVFDEVSVRNNAVVFLNQDSVQSVIVEGNEEYINQVFAEVKDGKLVIRYATDKRLDFNFKPEVLTFHITVPHIKRLLVSGAGAINSEGPVRCGNLDLYLSGSGSIKLTDLKAAEIHSTLSGSGHIELSGTDSISENKLIISGSGRINSLGLKAKNVSVILGGSGNCSVDADKTLNVKIAGSGNVSYTGNPTVKSKIIGSGKIIRKN